MSPDPRISEAVTVALFWLISAGFDDYPKADPEFAVGPFTPDAVGKPVELDDADGNAAAGIYIHTTTEAHHEAILRKALAAYTETTKKCMEKPGSLISPYTKTGSKKVFISMHADPINGFILTAEITDNTDVPVEIAGYAGLPPVELLSVAIPGAYD